MTTTKEQLQKRDLGLTYEEALHGVQTAIKFRMESEPPADAASASFAGPKHLRVGLDMRAADAMGLVSLLIDKGLITNEEYLEYIRLSANAELHGLQELARKLTGADGMSFR